MAGLAQHRFGAALILDREGRHFDDDPARHAGFDDRGHGRGERSGLGRLVMMVLRLARDIGGIGSDLGAQPRQRPAARRRHIVADHAPTSGEEILRE